MKIVFNQVRFEPTFLHEGMKPAKLKGFSMFGHTVCFSCKTMIPLLKNLTDLLIILHIYGCHGHICQNRNLVN